MMNDWRLRQLPVSARIVLTSFLLMVAAGYGLGLANIVYSHRMADGRDGLSLDDLRAVYSGIQVEVKKGQAAPSRMLEMIDGQMREFLETEADYQTLRGWLAAGARPDAFEILAAGMSKSPQDIITDSCIRCHNPEGEKGQEKARKSPFAADLFKPADIALVGQYTVGDVDETSGRMTAGPQSRERLVLIAHTHMLSIPVFTLITSFLVLFTGLNRGTRGVLAATPMVALIVDFAAWWLARRWASAVWLIAASGLVYGLLFGAQIIVSLLSMWLGRRTDRGQTPF